MFCMSKKKFSCHIISHTGGRVLQIPRAQAKDSGRYTCVAMNEAGEDSIQYDVRVLCESNLSVYLLLNAKHYKGNNWKHCLSFFVCALGFWQCRPWFVELVVTCLMTSQCWLIRPHYWSVRWMEVPLLKLAGWKTVNPSPQTTHTDFCPMAGHCRWETN